MDEFATATPKLTKLMMNALVQIRDAAVFFVPPTDHSFGYLAVGEGGSCSPIWNSLTYEVLKGRGLIETETPVADHAGRIKGRVKLTEAGLAAVADRV